jgi:hypothetical protein
MPNCLVKLVAITLLLMQSVLAFAPGRVLCLSFGGCTIDADSSEVAAEEARSHSGCCHHDAAAPCKPGDPFQAQSHPDKGCGCHVHVRVPRAEQVSNGGATIDVMSRVLLPAMVVAEMCVWEPPTVAPWTRLHSQPESGLRAQQCALKATRLLI